VNVYLDAGVLLLTADALTAKADVFLRTHRSR
jgi:hypothetical protein